MWQSFYDTMIAKGRWRLVPQGLGTTLLISICAVAIGSVLGCAFALLKISKKKPLVAVANVYTTVIRGIPMATQLMIFYFVIFSPMGVKNAVLVAIISFGINSGAYCTEIFRAGIQGVDAGQMEAARSLGLSKFDGMQLVVLPQAIKNVLPALANEIITMVKESSICSMLGMAELMFGAKAVASSTYITLAPYTLAALIYFCINYPASKAIEAIERRMRRGDKQ